MDNLRPVLSSAAGVLTALPENPNDNHPDSATRSTIFEDITTAHPSPRRLAVRSQSQLELDAGHVIHEPGRDNGIRLIQLQQKTLKLVILQVTLLVIICATLLVIMCFAIMVDLYLRN
jgi:hypothetical protein